VVGEKETFPVGDYGGKNSVEMFAESFRLYATGKQFGHNVSFSLRRTKRVFKPNLQKKTFVVDGQKVTMTLSTQAIRTLKKKGILATAK
jgi:large subunit ribosomal protein L28